MTRRTRLHVGGLVALFVASAAIASFVETTRRPAEPRRAPECLTFEITNAKGEMQSVCMTDAELGEQVRVGHLEVCATKAHVMLAVRDIIERRRLGH